VFLSTKVLLQTDLAVSKTITGLLIPYPFVSRFSAIPWGIHHLPQVQHMHSGGLVAYLKCLQQNTLISNECVNYMPPHPHPFST